jgi:hypothetical protein
LRVLVRLQKTAVYGFFTIVFLLFHGCKDDTSHLFTLLSSSRTGIDFANTLTETDTQNLLNYIYFYNGGGVAIGDINGDGLPDILLTGNQMPTRLYLNKGNFKFEDITESSGLSKATGWCTGATMADVNGDGKLDIYICRSGDKDPEKRRNLLFINNGNNTFTEEAKKYGLDDDGYSTQAVFFDYDKDGDLDMFLINHSLKQYSTDIFESVYLRQDHDPDFACKLYRNDNGRFHDVSKEAGITSNLLTFGLGVAVSDVNNDGWPDIYVSNDFNEPDYLFMNNGNGTFTEKLSKSMDEVPLSSMGSDFADINNTGYTDLMTLDMLPESNHDQKMHSGTDNFNDFQFLFKSGFYYQYKRNMLQKNNGDGTFSEIGQFSGVSNTDWSWSALFADFDNDGYKDLFITNGVVHDLNNMDFVKYQSNILAQQRFGNTNSSPADMEKKMPAVIIPNYIFKNAGDYRFSNKIKDWGLDQSSVSSGAAYADLNNDGGMDLVVNNINQKAFVYKNNAPVIDKQNAWLKVKFQGSPKNTFGIGSKVKVYCKGNLYYQEQFPVRGFQSSVDMVLNFGLGRHDMADSVVVIWPDDKMQKLTRVKARQILTVKWTDAPLKWKADTVHKQYFKSSKAPDFVHKEPNFNDFTVQPLMPNYLSRQGPCLAKADINGDGREDIFVGGAKGQPGKMYIQQADGSFVYKPDPAIEKDSLGEAVKAEFIDVNNDGKPDLYIANGGYGFNEKDPLFQDHIYVNDGKGNFISSPNALPPMLYSKGCVKAADINGDGAMDLFVGGRVVPGKYPVAPQSMILLNDGKGHFRDATKQVCPELANIGMVTDAVWIDLNGDKQPDLVVVGEWMPIKVFINHKGKLIDESSKYIRFPSNGLWNTVYAADLNGDGKPDLIVGNIGLNTQFKISPQQPMSVCYKDFDSNGSIDPILCYYIDGVNYPAPAKDDLLEQIPVLKNKFPDYASYADATLQDIFTPEQLKDAITLKAETAETVYLENDGNKGFKLKKLPLEAQYSPVYSIVSIDANHDGKPDLVLTGNNAWTRIKFGRYEANHGILLLNDGEGNFRYVPQNISGFNLRNDIRSAVTINTSAGQQIIFGANDAPLKAYTLNPKNKP